MKYCTLDPCGEEKRKILEFCTRHEINTFTLQEEDGIAYFSRYGGFSNRWGILFTDEPIEFGPSGQMLFEEFQKEHGTKENLELEKRMKDECN